MTNKNENKNIDTVVNKESQSKWNYLKTTFVRPAAIMSTLFLAGYLAFNQPKQATENSYPYTDLAIEITCQGDSTIFITDTDYDGGSDRKIVVYRENGRVTKSNTYDMTKHGWTLKKGHTE